LCVPEFQTRTAATGGLYHRKEGRVVKLADDLLSASRYAMMMRRFGRVEGGGWSRKIVYPPSGIV
jgi:hypothetical protein